MRFPATRNKSLTLSAVLLVCCSLLAVQGDASLNLFDLGSTSPYHPFQSPATYELPPSECVLQHVSLVARHGSRNPTSGDISKMAQLRDTLAPVLSSIQADDLQWLKTWALPFQSSSQGELVASGMLEHYHLAQRLAQVYSVLNSPYTPSSFNISATQVTRTGQSASSFAYGLFENSGPVFNKYTPIAVNTASLFDDIDLRFFDTCPAYIAGVIRDPASTYESDMYALLHLGAIADNMTAALNVTGFNVTIDMVSTIWSLCKYEVAVLNISTQFCTFISQSSADTLNYVDDLRTYYQMGYGNPINYLIAAPLLQSIFDDINKGLQTQSAAEPYVASLRFAHAETVAPLLALLGLYNDTEPLSAFASPEEIQQRLWRASALIPFSANVALGLYRCSNVPSPSVLVSLIHNERQVAWPGCESSAVNTFYCPWSVVQSIYSARLATSFESLCTPATPPSTPYTLSSASWAVVVVGAFAFGLLCALISYRIYMYRRSAQFRRSYLPLNG